MKLRRALSTFVLAVLVLGGQQAAFVHALSHQVTHGKSAGGASIVAAIDGTAAVHGGADGTGDANYCDKCFQFAHVTGAAVAHQCPQLAFFASAEPAHARPVAELAAAAPPARSRDPPAIL